MTKRTSVGKNGNHTTRRPPLWTYRALLAQWKMKENSPT